MMTSSGKTAQQLLDEVWSLAQLDAFRAGDFVRQLGDEVATLAARVEPLGEALAAIDTFTSKTMRIRLAHVLAADTALPAPFRTYLASQVTDYEGDLPRLGARVASTMARIDPDAANRIADAVVDAATRVLALRAELRRGVLALMPPPEEPAVEAPPPNREDLIEMD